MFVDERHIPYAGTFLMHTKKPKNEGRQGGIPCKISNRFASLHNLMFYSLDIDINVFCHFGIAFLSFIYYFMYALLYISSTHFALVSPNQSRKP
jgi:hypothetical protein